MSSVHPRHFVVTLAQLSLLAVAIRTLGIEKAAGLPMVAPLLVGGWAVWALLPATLQPAAFLVLSVIAIVLQLGSGALWLFALGLGLFGIAHLPVPAWLRGLLYALSIVVLGVLRAGVIEAWWAPTVIPVLASMFMFRMVLYAADLAPGKASWVTRLSYFFMLPNVFFPLFPIVDWGLWRKTPKSPMPMLHRRGVQWIARGVMHLLAYRLVYHLVLPPSWEVVDAASVFQWMAAVYLLYLRISGQYHLVIGIVLLFGYELPETHHLYFFASSFNDYWRRVNVYWTQYLEKLVFYPAFLRFRRWGVPQPLVAAIGLTFFTTWVLHAYQWFWLRGQWHFSFADALFWAMLGSCLAANSVWEANSGKKSPAAAVPDFASMLQHSAQTVLFFCTMGLLWSFWYTDSAPEWFHQMSFLAVAPSAVLMVVAGIAAAILLGVALQFVIARPGLGSLSRSLDGERNPAASLAVCVGLVALGAVPRFDGEPLWIQSMRDAVATEHLNEQDTIARTRGYYESLQPEGAATGELWRANAERPADWVPLRETEFVRDIDPPAMYDMVPNIRGRFMDAEVVANSYGMRDKEYTLQKPRGTYRIAVLGASWIMGTGVNNDQTFENVLEDRLNDEFAGGTHQKYEVLNFGIAGYSSAHMIGSYAQKARQFQPDLVILFDHDIDGSRLITHFSHLSAAMWEYPNAEIQDIGNEVWANAKSQADMENRLRPYIPALTQALFRQLAEQVQADGATLMWVSMPPLDDGPAATRTYESRREWARSAGMITKAVRDAYKGRDPLTLQIAPWDDHPNIAGHQLISNALYRELLEAERENGLNITR